MAFSISYDLYLDSVKHLNKDETNEAGQRQFTPMSEEEWNAIPNEQRYLTIAKTTGDIETFKPEDDVAAAFREKYGAETWQADQSGRPDHMGTLFYGYGDPRQGVVGDGPEQFAIDPSRIMYLPDGRWVMELSNVKGEWLAQDQATDDRTSNQFMTRIAVAVVAMAVAGAAMAGAEGSAGAAADTLGTAPGQGFGTQGSGFSSYAGATPAPAAPAGAGTTGINYGDPLPQIQQPQFNTMNPTPDFTAPPGGTPSPSTGTPSPSTGTPTGPPGDVVPPPSGSPTGAPTGTPTTPPAGNPAGNGIINTVRNGYNTVADWYSGLSPISRQILGAGVSYGAQAIIGARAQNDAEEERNRILQDERDDRIRRGSIPAFGSAFTTKPGIINSRRGG